MRGVPAWQGSLEGASKRVLAMDATMTPVRRSGSDTRALKTSGEGPNTNKGAGMGGGSHAGQIRLSKKNQGG